jgi:hypothetical protein
VQSHTRSAIVAFALSRLLVFAILIAASQMAFLQRVYSNSIWETRIELQTARLAPELTRVAMSGDAWWYRSIAMNGYDKRPFDKSRDANWAFFPLFPLLTKTVGIFGDFAIDAMVVSNIAFLAALLLLAELTAAPRPADASRAVFYAAFFPTSYFFSLPQTESLFLALALWAFLAAEREQWWAAGLAGALASLARVSGILLFPALLVFALQRKRRVSEMVWLALIPAGLGAFMFYLHRVSGNALAFADIQSRWGRGLTPPWRPIIDAIKCLSRVSVPWNFVALNLATAILLLVVGVVFAIQREWPYAIFTLGSVLLPLSSGSLQSISRYALTVFPLFVFLAIRGRNGVFDRCVMAIFTTLLGCLTLLAALRVDLALT